MGERLFTCEVPLGTQKSEFTYFPGDESAIAAGCSCPGQILWPRAVQLREDCPLHELKRRTH